jgi:Intra-flagellar transport protein 57
LHLHYGVITVLQAAQATLGKEWRSHVQQAKAHEAVLQSGMPDTNSQLSVIASEVADTLDKLRTKERYVNSQNEPARVEYGKVSSFVVHTHCCSRCPCYEQTTASSMCDTFLLY